MLACVCEAHEHLDKCLFYNSVVGIKCQKFHDKQQVVYNSFPLYPSLEKLLSTFLPLLLTLSGYDQ